ncbi:MAG: OmpH family outer membrane protein [bacterium]
MGITDKIKFSGLFILGLCFLVSFLVSPLRAEEGSQTGYVHLEQAMRGYEAFVEAMEEVEEFEENQKEQMRQRGKKLEEEYQKLQKEGQFLSPEEQQQRQQELMQKHQQFQMEAQQIQQQVKEKEAELLEPIHQQVQEVVAGVARQEGFEKIVRYDLEGSDIVWVEEELDITEELKSKLSEKSEAKEEEENQ